MSTLFGTESQQDSAQRMYSARATTYEDSWHPRHSRRFTAGAPLKPGDRVLDLCCGTGLEAFLAAEAVGEEGRVVGVDVTEAMLRELQARQEREPILGERISTVLHDVTDLSGLEAQGVEKGLFDVILCSCAFVLFHEPSRVVAHWREFLRPGGVMVIDVTHELNLRPAIALEEVAREMGAAWPSNRLWIKSRQSFADILEANGMRVESVTLLEDVSGKGTRFHGVDDADGLFETLVNSSLTVHAASEDFRARARPLFRRRWEQMAVDGTIEESDSLYLYVARKAEA